MLVIKNLKKSFQNKVVISDFNAEFDKGIHLISGVNGSGKTTLLNLISSILQMDEGSIEFDGASHRYDKKKYLRSITVATSNSDSFFQQLTGLENLEFFTLANGSELNLDKLENTYPSFYKTLAPLLGRRFHTYSSGMQRKLSLFRALLQKNKIALLDEPFMHLDKSASNELLNYISNDNDRIYIIATHRQDLFSDISYQEWKV